ncbi:MAG: type III pantothenate kinase [Bacteroidales bacterium]|nr:type III pantothenate kinase [Bacteroidales bacterium]MBP5635651.1 type III pantothenate kinase [Bacteroidales bacterium]
MANLVVEIGNTALKAALAEGPTLGKTFRYQGEKRLEYIADLVAREKPEVLTVASAAPVTPAEEAQLRACCRRLILLDAAHTALQEEKGLPAYLSCDRAASLLAARHLFRGKSCTVVDFGTTLTVDFLSAEGEYLGGNISPGCRTRFKALNRYSRTLPLVDTPEETGPVGLSLRSSIEAGVISGIMFEITGYVGLHPENCVVFTGGDAIYFVKRMKNSIFVVCNLVLMGLALMTDAYAESTLQ